MPDVAWADLSNGVAPHVRAHKNAVQALAATTITALTWPVIDTQVGGTFLNAGDSAIVIPSAGWYLLTAGMLSSRADIDIWFATTSSAGNRFVEQGFLAAAADAYASISTCVFCNAGDSITLFGFLSGAGNLGGSTSGGGAGQMSVTKLAA